MIFSPLYVRFSASAKSSSCPFVGHLLDEMDVCEKTLVIVSSDFYFDRFDAWYHDLIIQEALGSLDCPGHHIRSLDRSNIFR